MIPTVTADTTASAVQTVFSEIFSVIGADLIVFAIIIIVVILLRGSLYHVRNGQRQRHSDGKASMKAKAMAADVCAPKVDDAVGPRRESRNHVAKTTSSGAEPIGLVQIVALTISTRLQASKALAYYKEFVAEKRHLKFQDDLAAAGSNHTALEFYIALVQCAGRAGYPEDVLRLLDDMKEARIERPASIYESAMRLLARHKFFKEAVQVYDRLDRDGLKPSPVTLSCLVGFAAELGDVDRAQDFFQKLVSAQAASVKACMSILRLYAKRGDWASSLALFKQIKTDVVVDSVLLNIILATGVAAGELEAAKDLLIEEFSVADVVSHNTILKGLAQQGDVEVALELIRHMKEFGITPNLISFNTAMDASIRGGRPSEAWRLFDILQKEYGLKPDKCTCSTLVKGFTKSTTPSQIETMLDLIDAVFEECSAQLRTNLLSGTLDVSLRIGHKELAMRTFSKMRSRKVEPSAKELRALLTLTSRAGDIEGCTAAWGAASECFELMHVWPKVKTLMAAGQCIDKATLELAPRYLAVNNNKVMARS